MSSISPGLGSGRGERVDEMWQNVQETLREQRYPGPAHYPVVQSLKELVSSSVHMETSGDPLVTAWTAQPGGSKDILIGFQSLVDYLSHETDSQKTELLNSLVYPLFVNCYISLLTSNDADSAKRLYADTSQSIDTHCVMSEELQQLLTLTSAASLQSSPLVERYRSGKYFVRLSELAFTMLMSFLQAHPTTALLNIIHKHFNIEVFGCKVGQPVSEQKPEGKKTLNFIKPKIEVLPDSEFSLSSFPRPLPPPPPPPFVPMSSGEEALAAKHEFQSKLTGAIQQLSPSVPSLLVCTVQAAENTWVQCAALSSQTKEFSCGLDDSSIVISSWLPRETERGDLTSLKGHHEPVHGLSYEPNGRYLLSASEDKTVRLWDTRSYTPCALYEGHSYPVWDVSFSSVDGYFATASYDRTARLWNTDRLYPLRIFAGHDDSTDVARFHPNGSYIATGSKDRTIRLWDINTGNCVRLFPGSKSPITVVAFSPFGKYLATATQDGTITLWDLGMSRIDWEVKAHTKSVTSLAYSCDGTLLASTSEDMTIKLWNMKAVLVNTASPGSNQGLISAHSTGALLPLHASFTHRNCLIVVGVPHTSTGGGGGGGEGNGGKVNSNTNNNTASQLSSSDSYWRYKCQHFRD